jgi:hypothetical protein
MRKAIAKLLRFELNNPFSSAALLIRHFDRIEVPHCSMGFIETIFSCKLSEFGRDIRRRNFCSALLSLVHAACGGTQAPLIS